MPGNIKPMVNQIQAYPIASNGITGKSAHPFAKQNFEF